MGGMPAQLDIGLKHRSYYALFQKLQSFVIFTGTLLSSIDSALGFLGLAVRAGIGSC